MDRSGQTLGKYKLIRRLGKGGMAEVYLANQPTIERMVAVKVLHRHLAENDDFILRFKREARSLGQLQHPNIVNIIDFDAEEDVYYMVMDYIAGPTLRTYLDEKHILGNEEALNIMAQLVEGLAYAHQKGAIHRDLKPANVMFMDETHQQAVITDFGITRLVNDKTITVEGSMVGTPAYMSPEAVIGERVDGRSDIYSLGVILYEMVTGRTPYEGATPLSLVVKQVHDPLPSPLEFRPDLAPQMATLIEKALSKDVNGRYQTAYEFFQAIQQTQTTLQLPIAGATLARATIPAMPKPNMPPKVEPVKKATETQPSFDLKKYAPMLGGAALLLLLIVGGIAIGNRNRTPEGNDGEVNIPITVNPDVVVEVTPLATITPEGVIPPVETEPVPTETVDVPVEMTETAVSPPVVEEIPQVEAGRTGTVQILSDVPGQFNGYQVQIERVPQPPAGSHYNLWVAGEDEVPQNLGELTFENQTLTFAPSSSDNLTALICKIFITQELDGQVDTELPSEVLFDGAFSPEVFAHLQGLFDASNGRLSQAEAQLAIAQQHTQFGLDSLANNNLDEAKQHMEHVVNILDGDTGQFFGDLNLDGQAQNPGDGVGVRVYLEESGAIFEQLPLDEPITLERQRWSEDGVTAVTDALDVLNTAIQRASALTSTDTVQEASPIAEELERLIEEIVVRNTAVFRQALTFLQIPVFNQATALAPPDAIVGTAPNQFGLFQLINGANGTATQYRLRVAQLAPPADGQTYQAWLQSSGANTAVSLGTLTFVQGQAALNGTVENDILQSFDQVLITAEAADAVASAPSATVILQGDINTPATALILNFFATEFASGKGPLFGVEDQLAVAIQHHAFAQESLSAGNLDEAKIHIEHVINILDGRSGATFGDLNGDGQAQNPGDDVGVRAYWEQTTANLTAFAQDDGLTGNQKFYTDLLITMAQNNQSEVETTLNQASKVFASDTVEEAQGFLDVVNAQLDVLENGRDLDANGTIDPLFGEGGITAVSNGVLWLNDVPLIIVE